MPELLAVSDLVGQNADYQIPIYQRNYSWKKPEIETLLQDVCDFSNENKKSYYLGTLVVFKRAQQGECAEVHEVIDGQQRLTTLTLLLIYLKHQIPNNAKNRLFDFKLNLKFEQRPRAIESLRQLYERASVEGLDQADLSIELCEGFDLIGDFFRERKLLEGEGLERFVDCLLDDVKIMRVAVPEDTDLNKYFEVMNNRGEQLEQHEILKAKMLESLLGCKADAEAVHRVWDSCADMSRYLQEGFREKKKGEREKERERLFGANWNELQIQTFDELSRAMGSTEAGDLPKPLSLSEIVTSADIEKGVGDSRQMALSDRFESVIDFPNFLLHVLRLFFVFKNDVESAKRVSLDDKKLLKTFTDHINTFSDPAQDVKDFIFCLFKVRYFFDQYVIKRDVSKGVDNPWSLNELHKGSVGSSGGSRQKVGNRRLDMLLSAFHVSAPTHSYKHWLTGALYFLCLLDEKELTSELYLKHLEGLAKAFVFRRYLVSDEKNKEIATTANEDTRRGVVSGSYDDMVFSNYLAESGQEVVGIADFEPQLTYQGISNNFVFNYLDYLLWLRGEHLKDKYISGFRFSSRNSVEHHFPQHPKYKPSEDWKDKVHKFGNLCLISHSENSRWNNDGPDEKAKRIHASGAMPSIKQALMVKSQWSIDSMAAHHDEMVWVLHRSTASSPICGAKLFK